MKKPPNKMIIRNREYYYLRSYSHFYLYEDEYGMKECFKAQELGMVPKYRVVNIKWSKMEGGNCDRQRRNTKPFIRFW